MVKDLFGLGPINRETSGFHREITKFTMSQEQIDRLSRTIKVNPKHVVCRMKRAKEYLKLKNYKKCQKDCHFVLGLQERNIRCLIYLAACYLAEGNKEKAIDNLVMAGSQYDVDDEYRYVLSEIEEWETAVLIPITDPEFIPADKRVRHWDIGKPKPEGHQTWNDKYAELQKGANMFCMPVDKY